MRARIKNGFLWLEDESAIAVEGVLSAARAFRKAAYTGPDTPEETLDMMLHLVEALQEQVCVANAARVVHAALQEDESLLEAVDSAYRLGGAKAVRDMLLRGTAQGGG